MRKLPPLLLLTLGIVASAGYSLAGTLTFDSNTTPPATDGSGAWNTTTTNWYNNTTDVAWPNTTDTAAFGAGVAGTYAVTVGTVNAGAITFNLGGYTLSGGTITMNPVSAATGFTLTTTAGTDTVSSPLAGVAGSKITKTGPGTLALSSVTGGTAASPILATVSGGAYSAATGYFSSVLSITNGATMGSQPSPAANQFTLDAGTLRFTGAGNANGSGRTIQVTANGGAIIDAGGGYAFNDNIALANNASLFLSNNGATATTYFRGDGFTAVAISGTGANVTWNGPGTAVFGSNNTFTGGTTVNAGTLSLTGGGGAGAVRGTVTINAGATLSLDATDALGYTAGTQVTTLNINGGTVNKSTNGNQGFRTSFNLTGGSVTATGGGNYRISPGDATAPVITSNASPVTSQMSGNFDIASGTLPVTVASGSTASGIDLQISGQLFTSVAVPNTVSFVKNGPGTLGLAAGSVFGGTTTINAGTVVLNPTLRSVSGGTGKTLQIESTLGPGTSLSNPSITVASTAAIRSVAGDFPVLLGSTPDSTTPLSGNITATGLNSLRISTGTTISPGTYTVLSTSQSSLGSGTFQLDGATTLTVPATSMIKEFGGTTATGGTTGGTFYRLTVQQTPTSAQVVVSPAAGTLINLMPIGSSITEGISSQPEAYAGGGYRSQLYQSLVNDGRFIPNLVGSNTVLDNQGSTGGYNVLTGSGQIHHEGHGGYTTSQVLTSLNYGAKWLGVDGTGQPNNGVVPDYVTLSIGGNDYGNSGTAGVDPVNRTDAIISYIQTLRPASHVIVSNLFYRVQTPTVGGGNVGDLQNTYYNPNIPVTVYNHILAGHHVSLVDQSSVTPGNDISNIGPDGIHPLTTGYQLAATNWYNALAFGSAFWTGGQGGQWSDGTNFAQNYQLTTPRQTPLAASTDVHFNSNTSPLSTTLGQDLAVRSVNFAAGATGAVTIGGANTLTLGTGGITVQAGTGAHTLQTAVALGANQTWGNVSSNPFTVSGVVSGNSALTLTSSYTINNQVNAANNDPSYTPSTFTGTSPIILSGANTYTGGTTVSNGTLVVSNTGGSATGTGNVTVGGGSTLTDNGAISGSVLINGTTNGSGTFNGAVTVNSGGVFGTAGTVNGPLTIGNGGLLMLSGGTLNANGGVVNNGTILLERGAALAVGNGTTFTNNGVLDIITGSFTAPGGFTNNGAIIDSSVVSINGATLAGGTFTVNVNGYSGHTYQLQSSSSLTDTPFTNLGSPQSGITGNVLTFTDNSPSATQNFYRVQIDP